MSGEIGTRGVWKGRNIRVLVTDRWEQERRLHEAVARQAYCMFEAHGRASGHEAEDWKQAESEVVRPLECGLIAQDDKVSICADLGAFAEGNVEICVLPRRLSLCGRPCGPLNQPGGRQREATYRVLDLPVEVDPARVHARVNGRILEIDLYRTPPVARAA